MNVYITDGTPECFYTAAFHACTDKDCVITSSNSVQLSLGAHVVQVQTDLQKCARVRKKLLEYDAPCLKDVSLILRRGCAEKEMTALNYLRLIVEHKAPVRNMLAHPAVIEAMQECKKVTYEAHRFTGFLRFMQAENDLFYAPFDSDNDILDLLVPHFVRRLANQSFIIHDVARKKAALYNTKQCVTVPTDDKVRIPLCDCERDFQSLWKQYYKSVNVAERPHERQMKGYMPVRYWKYMPEKH